MTRVVGTTARQHECLQLIREHHREKGWYPPYRWLAEKMGVENHGDITRMVYALRDHGLVRIRRNYGIVDCSRARSPNDIGAIYAACGSAPIGKIGDARRAA